MNGRAFWVSTLLLIVVLTASHVQAGRQQPNSASLKDVLITMETDGQHCGCVPFNETDLSCCPIYSISISGDGSVTYEGIASVRVRGKRTYSIPVGRIRELVDEFRKVDFFSMKDRYVFKDLGNGRRETITHGSAMTVSIRLGDKTKSVYNFYGAPAALGELQRKIYEISQAAKFVGRT